MKSNERARVHTTYILGESEREIPFRYGDKFLGGDLGPKMFPGRRFTQKNFPFLLSSGTQQTQLALVVRCKITKRFFFLVRFLNSSPNSYGIFVYKLSCSIHLGRKNSFIHSRMYVHTYVILPCIIIHKNIPLLQKQKSSA